MISSVLRQFLPDLREVLPNLATLSQERQRLHSLYSIQQFNPEFLETIKHVDLHKKALPGKDLAGLQKDPTWNFRWGRYFFDPYPDQDLR